MNQVKYQWLAKKDKKSDDVMSITSLERHLELAQLRRKYEDKCQKSKVRICKYSKNVWFLRISHYDNDFVTSHLGEDWEKEIHKGFETTYDFKEWIRDRQWRQNVFEKSY
tara:strand:- start:102 stop:431 length:330 start_codon:yes stop_codon:yes gene_type:complete